MYNKNLKLNNGIEVPQLGLGAGFIDVNQVASTIKEAVKLGYCHFDTAQAYGNERGVGEGILTCGIAREDLFVVSKVAAEHKTYQVAKESIDQTLEIMGLDYLDMMIIHSPQPWDKINQSDDRYVEGNLVYLISKKEDTESLLEVCEIKPMVNQILLHISNTPLDLIN